MSDKALRRTLLTRQTDLADHLTDLRRELDAIIEASTDANTDDEHDPEGTTIAFERSQLTTLIASAAAEQQSVVQALARVAAGTYGRCERCRRPIAPERLAARPASELCVVCAALT